MADIVEWAQSKYGFYVDRQWHDGKWRLKRAPIKLAQYHQDILRHLFTPQEDGRLPYDTIGWCEPAKSGKSAIAGLAAEYAALHLDKNSQVVMASNKQTQAASLMYKSATDSIEFNPHLRVKPGRWEVEFKNGNVIKAIPSSSKGESGARFTLALFDELWAYQYTDALRLWAEFKTDPTRLYSVKMALGYGGYAGESDLWQGLLERGLEGEPVQDLEHIKNADGQPACWRSGRSFVFWSHVTRQPWQTDEWLASQAEELTEADFKRMVLVEFVQASQESFIRPEWWQACALPGLALEPGSSTPLVVAFDLASGAGLMGDTCALVVACAWGDGYALPYVQVWEPPADGRFDFDATIGGTLRWLAQNFNVVCVCYDEYQAIEVVRRLREELGLWFKPFSQQSERDRADRAFYDLIQSGRLRHNGDETLTSHVLNAGSKQTSTGHLRLVKSHYRKKIDAAVASSMALYQAGRLTLIPDPRGQVRDAPRTEYQQWSEQRRQDVLSRMGMTLSERQILEGQERRLAEIQDEPDGGINDNIMNSTNGTIKAEYTGMLADGSFKILTTEGLRPVFRGTPYELPTNVWQNIMQWTERTNARPEWRQLE